MPDEYCCYGEFDIFGEWFSKYHDSPPCRKGIPIDDYREHDCDLEIFMERKSERDRMKREYDFMKCFQNPSTQAIGSGNSVRSKYWFMRAISSL